MRRIACTFLFLLAFSELAFSAAIGTITAKGRFELEGAAIWNQGTLLEGSRVATGSAASRLALQNGASLQVGTSSKVQVFADRLMLETGIVQGAIPRNFRMETESLGLRVEGRDAQVQVRADPSGKVLVASLRGELEVRGPRGLLLARLIEGNAVELSPAQGGATAQATLTGVLKNKDYKYTLTDETTCVTVELRGDVLARHVGHRISVIGNLDPEATAVSGADYVLRVTTLDLASGTTEALAGCKDGSGKLASKTGAGLSKLTKIGIIGGIAVAGGVSAGVVAAGGDEQPTVSPQPR